MTSTPNGIIKWTSLNTSTSNSYTIPRTAILTTSVFVRSSSYYKIHTITNGDDDCWGSALTWVQLTGVDSASYKLTTGSKGNGTLYYAYYDTNNITHTSITLAAGESVTLDLSKTLIENSVCHMANQCYRTWATGGSGGQNPFEFTYANLKITGFSGSSLTLTNEHTSNSYTLYYSYWS